MLTNYIVSFEQRALDCKTHCSILDDYSNYSRCPFFRIFYVTITAPDKSGVLYLFNYKTEAFLLSKMTPNNVNQFY